MTIAQTFKYLENSKVFDALSQISTCLESRDQTPSMNFGLKSAQQNLLYQICCNTKTLIFFIDN